MGVEATPTFRAGLAVALGRGGERHQQVSFVAAAAETAENRGGFQPVLHLRFGLRGLHPLPRGGEWACGAFLRRETPSSGCPAITDPAPDPLLEAGEGHSPSPVPFSLPRMSALGSLMLALPLPFLQNEPWTHGGSMSPQNSTGSTQDSDSWASSHSSDCQLLADDRRSRNAVAKGAVDSSLLADCPAFPAGFYDIRPQQTKRKKPPAKKLVLEQEVEKKVPPSAGKSLVLDQDRVKEPAALEGQAPPVKEPFSEPPIDPAGDPQPSAPLEEPLKEEKDWLHRAQGAEKPAGDDPQLKELDQCSGGRKSPSSCSTLDQSEGEDTSRGSSQLSGECPGSSVVLRLVPDIVPPLARASHMGCRESLQVVPASPGEGLQGKS